ncbi:hypothetical protein [Halovivax limisalsi]|uniref:hypothetical protein n=1 Tax=Halovivax limisalsi TaxID=1453760 RepID=UPI001FFDADD0|nr:hypothetical protein [Halovivax limisalsi]
MTDASDVTESADPADAADRTLPLCPYCETPIAAVTSTGPHTHSASPCGCRLTLVDVRAIRRI